MSCWLAGIQRESGQTINGRAAGRARATWRRHRDAARGRYLVGIDLGAADERDALLDDEFAGADVAEQFGLGLDLDALLGVDVAVDLAAHNDGLGVDVAGHDGGIPEVQLAFGLDFAFEFAFEGQFAGELEIPFNLDVGRSIRSWRCLVLCSCS